MRDPSASTPGLIVHSEAPLNAEPPLDLLRSSFLTPAAAFYIRSHGPIPALDAAAHRVRITGHVTASMDLGVADLQGRFAGTTLQAVLQCAGNRRADLQQVRPTSGDPWAAGAIGHAAWTGVRLADVLRAAGAATRPGLHVAFEGADIAANEGADDAPYGVSIPIETAMEGDVLLAWAMNGAPLKPEHGAPLRVVVPGFAGVRSTKWVTRIVVRDAPSMAFQQADDYLMFPPAMRKDTEDTAQGVPINAMPLNAAICQPAAGTTCAEGRLAVRGYAMATDRAITRVDVSINGGRDWTQASLEEHGQTRWSWTFWHAHVDLAAGEHEIVVRAWDAAGQTQPASPDDTWNFKGYLSAAWHRVRVTAA